MIEGVRIDRAAFNGMVAGVDGRRVLKNAADKIRDRARTNAESIDPSAVGAIESIIASDAIGPYADVGYNKGHGGFTLWWAEVGTKNQPSQPHLRPAVVPGMLDGA